MKCLQKYIQKKSSQYKSSRLLKNTICYLMKTLVKNLLYNYNDFLQIRDLKILLIRHTKTTEITRNYQNSK